MAASDTNYRAIVVIGPSGNGKSTLGQAIAGKLGWRFIEGDEHHPPENVAKMARGEPLTDLDRAPFLASIGKALAGGQAVAACSALKRTYRERLTAVSDQAILFVLPKVERSELLRRMESRQGHFMPPALLESQLATFELPEDDEACLMLDGTLPVEVLARMVAEGLSSVND